MDAISKSLVSISLSLWNELIKIAMDLFRTSPTAASGSIYAVAKGCFDVLRSISIPIMIFVFLLTICHEIVSSPPDQQSQKLFMHGMRFILIIIVVFNLWDIMGVIVDVTDGVTDTLATSVGTVSTSPEALDDMNNAIEEICEFKTTANFDIPFNILDIGGYLKQMFDQLMQLILDFFVWLMLCFLTVIVSLVMVVLYVSSGITIISCAYQRILRPLVMIPFSTITVALAAGAGESERVTANYIRSFIGLCISGAFMVVCVKLGIAIINGSAILTAPGGDRLQTFLFTAVRFSVMPLITAGLVKNVDGMIARFL